MKKKGLKRGLSEVMTTLIIILLVLVAIGIVWVVVSNIMRSGSEQVSLGKLTLNLNIKSASIDNGVVTTIVHRNPGDGELSGMLFSLSDGVNTEIIKETGDDAKIGVLGEATFELIPQNLVFIKEISVRPLLKSSTSSETELIGEIESKKTFSGEQTLKGAGGLVSWWNFEGDAKDRFGDNDGILYGGVDCNANGKIGKGCSFDGVDDYINISDTPSLEFNRELTVMAWVRNDTGSSDWYGFLNKGDWGHNYRGYRFLEHAGNYCFRIGGDNDGDPNGNKAIIVGPTSYDWNHVTGVVNETSHTYYTFYNGDLIYTGTYGFDISKNTDELHIGRVFGGFFDGSVDEVIIFNKSLSESEVKSIYILQNK